MPHVPAAAATAAPQDRTGDPHPVDEVRKPGPMVVYGLQHVMSMYAGAVAVPFIVGSALGLQFTDLAYLLAATLLVSGLATLVQTLGFWRIGARLPIVQGTSFAAVASMLAIGKAGPRTGPSRAE
jgi:uric acid transporter